jgi:hypothetical protein
MKFAAAVCGWGSIIAGFVAAVYWIWSACVGLPVAPDAVLVQTSPDDPFNVALRHATELNAYAAVWTGVSVLLAAVERVIRIGKR